MATSAAASSMLQLEFSSLHVTAAASKNVSSVASPSCKVVSWSGLRTKGLQQVGSSRSWRELKQEVRSRARVCAVAELFESEVLGTDGDAEGEAAAAEEAPVKTVKPKTGKAALLLKSDRVSAPSLQFL